MLINHCKIPGKILSHLWFTLSNKNKKLLMLTSSSSPLCILLFAAALQSSCSSFACLIMDGSKDLRMVFLLFARLCCSWCYFFEKNVLISLIVLTFSVILIIHGRRSLWLFCMSSTCLCHASTILLF